MRRRVVVCFLALVVMPAIAAEHLEDRWIGTWKLDPARSHFKHHSFTYSKMPNGMLHFEDGTLGSYDFAVDGKPYKSGWDVTRVWTTAGPNAWNVVVYGAYGKEVGKVHHVLSADGKTLTSTFTGTGADGSALSNERVATRVTGTTGLDGQWRDTKAAPGDVPDIVVVSSPSPGVLRFEWPVETGFVEGKPDGTDHPLTGAMFAPGSTMSFKYLSPDRIFYTAKVRGKLDGTAIQTLAADGKSFTDVGSDAGSDGKLAEKETAFYVRQ